MRALLFVAAVCLLAGCSSDKYSKVPTPTGTWEPANAHPESTDNNIIPDYLGERQS